MSEELCEEQEMEAEALAAIFDDCVEIISSTQPFEWAVDLYPEQLAADEEDEDAPQNHVGVKLIAKIPLTYPEDSLPEFSVKVLKGLTEEHEQELVALANEEAESNQGMPVMYAVCERLREWLLENNEKGMDDRSMYTQMLKREKEKEREQQKAKQIYEAQKQKEELTEAETEELAVRRRRAEGTPVTDETFAEWCDKFNAEMEEESERLTAEAASDSKKKAGKGTAKEVDKSGRLTGFQHFTDKAGTLNLEAIEAAAENAQVDEDEEVDVVDEDLFDLEDDDLDDLDDMDFDSDDEDDEPDI
mmetsp:Transcript_15317/g.38613  ORF Transcript_15317/g.38613 Transcript_15317/m.38613 type:complete len:303 (+) Transcript_15317:275-1183(+)|eukprot:CAMPEP_0116095006 /NCGR_PEP_ID=MMETSP0327-20121206/9433_1 /TAXON_ID=44447 /ORGANISM="Pseudo-nitzschia delicatissima, Strain B596" /LENGTH=302 /DNA_ID=CAMNT_0003586645 /DNA_START=215 /DNA_END=1123 /DNA_ORIENTATION=-